MCIERLPSLNFGSGSASNLDNADAETVVDEIDTDDDIDYSSSDDALEVFTDYMWMENEQEFEQEEIRRLEEEELTIQCLIAMGQLSLLDEIRQVEDEQQKESVLTDIAQKSSLNPFAAEFFPAEVLVFNM